jgi:hypothetical protein
MGKWASGIVVALCLLAGLNSASLAQEVNQQAAMDQAKADLSNLYQQWRQQQPADPISMDAFTAYTHKHPSASRVVPIGYNSFTEQAVNATYVLPGGGWILNYFKPTDSFLIGFVLDVNGNAPPNGHQFGIESDQVLVEMDAQGQLIQLGDIAP